MPRGPQSRQPPSGPTRNLFIAGFRSDMDDSQLRAIFGAYGAIESAKVMLDIHTGASRGFAFVLFENLPDAIAARDALNGAILRSAASPSSGGETAGQPMDEGVRLAVEFAKHDAFNVVTRGTKVYCRNIPTTMADHEIAREFEQLVGPGTVVAVSVLADSSRSPAVFDRARRGSQHHDPGPDREAGNVAFVEFKTTDDAQRAVDTTYRVRFDGPGSKGPLMTKFAETAEVRQERKKRTVAPERTSGTGGQHLRLPGAYGMPTASPLPPPPHLARVPQDAYAHPPPTPPLYFQPPPQNFWPGQYVNATTATAAAPGTVGAPVLVPVQWVPPYHGTAAPSAGPGSMHQAPAPPFPPGAQGDAHGAFGAVYAQHQFDPAGQ